MIHQIISQLAATRSRNEKEEILEKNKDNALLRDFFKAALDPFNTYYIRKIPEFTTSGSNTLTIQDAMNMLYKFKERFVTGNSAIELLQMMLTNMSADDAELLVKIIKKDPDCGVQKNTINKFWKKLISEYPVLLCGAYDKNLVAKLNWVAGVLVQLKSDGARCNIVIDEHGSVEMFSRQGRPIDCKGRFDYLGEKHRNVMIDGELLYQNPDGSAAERKIGNGIINKAIKGTISEEEAANLFLMAWDIVPLDDFKKESCQIKYIDRFNDLKDNYIDNDGLHLTPTKLVHSLEEAMEIYSQYREMGLEGTILKDLDALWENARSKKQIKLKAEIDSDLKVVGYQEGRDRFEGLMGALICESAEGKVNVSVGGGWSTDTRAQIAADYHNKDIEYYMVVDCISTLKIAKPSGSPVIGRILTVLHNGIISQGEGFSLYLPRAKDGFLREDKDVADTFEEISKQK